MIHSMGMAMSITISISITVSVSARGRGRPILHFLKLEMLFQLTECI